MSRSSGWSKSATSFSRTPAATSPAGEAELRKVVAVDLLLLDDFPIDVFDATEGSELHELLLERYRTGSMIVTSNRGAYEWPATFADPIRAQSAIDRFTSNAYDLVIDGEL